MVAMEAITGKQEIRSLEEVSPKLFDCWEGEVYRRTFRTIRGGKYVKVHIFDLHIPGDIAMFLKLEKGDKVEVALRIIEKTRSHLEYRWGKSPSYKLSKNNRVAHVKSPTTAPGLLPGASLKAARKRKPKQISSFRATNDKRRSFGKLAKACLSSERKSSITSRVRDDLSNLGIGNHNHSQKPYSLQKHVQALGATDSGTTEADLKSSKKDKGAGVSTSALRGG